MGERELADINKEGNGKRDRLEREIERKKTKGKIL
jgi:hypothetical protein